MRAWPCGGLLAAGLMAALPACTETPLVKVTISYRGFQPACVKLTAADSSLAAPQTVDVPVPAGSRQGELVAVVYNQGGWGSQLQVSVEAHEQACAGAVVASDRSNVTVHSGQTVALPLQLVATDADLDGYVLAPPGTDCDDARPDVHPGAPEVCNGRDDNCDTRVDEGFGVGVACGDAGACLALTQCAADGGTFCAPGKAWYPDSDSDGWGRTQAAVFACTRPDAGFVPDGGDCDDGNPRANPGLPEICDGIDNNCVSGVDEGFNVGSGCATQFGCPGMAACAPDGGGFCQSTGGTGLHPDEDGDGHGAPAEVCSADAGVPLVTSSDDCDDGDPFTAPGMPEICDRRDNDCDGVVDNDGGSSVCPAGATWVPLAAGGAGHQWRSVWSWTDGGAWAVGLAKKYRRHLPSDPFGVAAPQWLNTDSDCPNVDWLGVWADPLSGRAFAVGPAGSYCAHDLGNATDIDLSAAVSPSLGDPVSVVGIRSGAEITLYAVGRDGGTALWFTDGGSQALASTGVRLNDVHGTSPDNMFAAGVLTASSPPDGRLLRFMPPSGWAMTPLPAGVHNTGASVEAVFVVGPRLAYAVTDAGTVLEWDGGAWGLHSSPPAIGPLRGVLAFGRSSVFVIDAQTAWEWNGLSWNKLFDAGTGSLQDIHGTNPADIWVASDPQYVYHWPQ